MAPLAQSGGRASLHAALRGARRCPLVRVCATMGTLGFRSGCGASLFYHDRANRGKRIHGGNQGNRTWRGLDLAAIARIIPCLSG